MRISIRLDDKKLKKQKENYELSHMLVFNEELKPSDLSLCLHVFF